MTRHSGTSPNACTHNRTKNVAGVTDNPERGKAQGRNDRRAIKSMSDLIDGGDTDRSRERKPRSRIDSKQRPDRSPFRSVRFPHGRHDHPDENHRGADAIDQQARGPGRAEMLATMWGPGDR
jgi:hypothetical protein